MACGDHRILTSMNCEGIIDILKSSRTSGSETVGPVPWGGPTDSPITVCLKLLKLINIYCLTNQISSALWGSRWF